MKKLTLLFSTIILTIGIQSCSKEEISIKQELPLEKRKGIITRIDNIPVDFISIEVGYSGFFSPKDKIKVKEYFKKELFPSLLISTYNDEPYSIWYVSREDFKLWNYGNTKPEGARVLVSESKDNDEGPARYTIKIQK